VFATSIIDAHRAGRDFRTGRLLIAFEDEADAIAKANDIVMD